MSKKNLISIIVISLIILISGWAIITAKSLTKHIKPVSNISNESDVEQENANVEELIITETRLGKKFWDVCASSGKYDNSKNVAILTNVTGNFYKDNKVVLSFASPTATYSDKNKSVTLSGGAKAATDQKILITANVLKWAGSNDIITANGNVNIIKPPNILSQGEGSVFTTDFKKFKMLGNSKTSVYTK